MTATILKLHGLKCPLPVLRTRKALANLKAGDVLQVECTDPLAAIDIPNLLQHSDDLLDETRVSDGVLVFVIRKAGGAATG